MRENVRAAAVEILGQSWSQSFVEYTAKGLKNSVIETAIEHQKPFMVLVQAKTSEGPSGS